MEIIPVKRVVSHAKKEEEMKGVSAIREYRAAVSSVQSVSIHSMESVEKKSKLVVREVDFDIFQQSFMLRTSNL